VQIYSSLPTALLDGWTSREQTHPPLEQVGFHYHHAEEWLQVTQGEITFYSLSRQPWPLAAGSVFRIPRGEVHSAEIGAAGVTYRMYVPIEFGAGFSIPLDAGELKLLATNLEFPLREENADGGAGRFFTEHLSDHLAFCRANGDVVGKKTYLEKFTAMGRSSDGTVCILNRTADAVLLSTGVTVGTGTPGAKSFTNLRLFKQEDGVWKCRVWVNVPAAPSPPAAALPIM